jgi:hypothetical protein
MTSPVLVDQSDLREEHWLSPKQGGFRWKTMPSGDVTTTTNRDCSFSAMSARDTIVLRARIQTEVGFGIDDATDRLKPGVALFIPGNDVHDVIAADQHVRRFDPFAAEAFSDNAYMSV